MNAKRLVGLVVILGVVAIPAGALAAPVPREDTAKHKTAEQILAKTAIYGGLVVHIGCGEGKVTAALRTNERIIVHGLDPDPANVAKARKHVRSLGLYGKVSIAQFDGSRLPYADNLVNVVVSENPGKVPLAEITRVLAPGGTAYVRTAERLREISPGSRITTIVGGKWIIRYKARPDDIDEWTHHLHDAGGNPVANDRVVGPPRRMQWTDGPLWARSHGYTPSVSAMVSANNRLFAIVDETLTGADPSVPSKWTLVARDAFNGLVLWKKPVPVWGSAAFSGTPDTGGGAGSVGRFTMPPNVGKRLVAEHDTVFVTLGPRAPVTALDAATGKTRRVFKDTARADEILHTFAPPFGAETLYVSINPDVKIAPPTRGKSDGPASAPGKHVCAVDVDSGRILWKAGPFEPIRTTKGQDPFGRLEMALNCGRVVLLTRKSVEALDARTGKRAWRIDRPALPEKAVTRVGYSAMYEYGLTVMIAHDGVVLLAQPEPDIHHTYHTTPGTLYAFDVTNGKPMWKHPYGAWGHHTQHDVFVVGDDVWTHVHATKNIKFGSSGGGGKRVVNGADVAYRIQAINLWTGKVRKEWPVVDLFNVGHHHRCYRNKITERFLTSSRRGVEFVNLATGENQQHHWVRSGCLYGILPCNGLLYTTPHPCGCYREVLLTGFNALAPAAERPLRETASRRSRGDGSRLVKGPAYSKIPQSAIRNPQSDWATYRHDAKRSGATESPVSAELTLAWRANIGAKPSGLTVAGGKVHVAAVDAHTVHALNAADGKPAWTYTADARVDSPPTIHEGAAIFGSADGRVYCVRDTDGALAWRFDAAPFERRVMAFGQLESPWPVSGSVMMQGGKCWFAAGRSSYLDGGIRVFALDPATGKVARRETIYSPDPKTGMQTPSVSQRTVPGVLNDILHTDGENVFIRQMNVSPGDARAKMHLYSTGGFLDPSWFNRTFWKAGRAQTSGVMVLGKDAAYGMELYRSRSRETVFKPGGGAYRLVCRPLKAPATARQDPKARRKGRNRELRGRWEQRVAIRVTAMVRAGDTLFVAGPPDVVDPKDPHAAWEGRAGGVLAVFATADGKKLAEYKLPAPPVWDGLAAAGGRLYVATANGDISAFK